MRISIKCNDEIRWSVDVERGILEYAQGDDDLPIANKVNASNDPCISKTSLPLQKSCREKLTCIQMTLWSVGIRIQTVSPFSDAIETLDASRCDDRLSTCQAFDVLCFIRLY